MPCTISKEEELWYELEGNKKKYGIRETTDIILTKVACDLAQCFPPSELTKLNKLTLKWIKEHKKQDKIREQRQEEEKSKAKFRRQALAKLTDRDKEILGLK